MDRRSLIAIARRDFLSILPICFEILKPGVKLISGPHIEAICHELCAMEAGGARRLIVNMPPRTLKSTVVSAAWPAFLLGLNPATEIIVTTYKQDLSETLSGDTRQIMESPIYAKIFPGTRLSRSTRDELRTTAGGGRRAISVAGGVTGFGADWIIIDDPHDANEAHSPSARNAVGEHYTRALLTRLNDRNTGKFVLVMQRLHEDDLAGRFIATGNWPVLRLPARAREDLSIDIGRPQPFVLKAGQLLMPGQLSPQALDDLQREMGSVDFQAQYQQDPVPDGGNIIKRDWLTYYDQKPDTAGDQMTMSVDTATKTDTGHDFSVITIWLMRDGKHYLIEVWREKVEFPDLRRRVLDLWQYHKATNLLIEDQGTGTALIQELKNVGVPAIGRAARGEKLARLSGVSNYFEARQVVLPREAPWLALFESELLGFPNVKHDDQVDTVSQYLGWVRERFGCDKFEYDFGFDEPLGPDHDLIARRLLASRRFPGPR